MNMKTKCDEPKDGDDRTGGGGVPEPPIKP